MTSFGIIRERDTLSITSSEQTAPDVPVYFPSSFLKLDKVNLLIDGPIGFLQHYGPRFSNEPIRSHFGSSQQSMVSLTGLFGASST